MLGAREYIRAHMQGLETSTDCALVARAEALQQCSLRAILNSGDSWW